MTEPDRLAPHNGELKAELEGHYYRNWLRISFAGAIEERYRRYCGRADRRYVRNLANVLILLYVSYGFFDWFLLRDDVGPVWVVRYAAGLPGLLLTWIFTKMTWAERFIDKLIVACLFWLTVTTLFMVRLVPPDVMDLYLSSVLAIILAGMTITRLRFWMSVATGVLFLLSVAVLIPGVHVNPEYLLYYGVLCTGVVMFCVIAQYSADRGRRREFLQRILIHRKNQELRKLNLYLRDLAELDALTGIANRRYFDVVLDEELRRARRREYSVALLMCDIDFFKPYNDLLGHVQGDVCIRQVAQLIHAQARRPGDLVARYGGEEFAVILPALDVHEAQKIAQLICDKIAAQRIPHPGSKVADHVTISIGVSALVPHDEHSQKILINQADEALYAAKNKGRNQVQIFQPEIVHQPAIP